MKKLLLIISLFLSITTQAQKPWEKLQIDSANFAMYYGTAFQYNYQQDISNKSSHKMLFLFTGAQYMYLYHMALYLGYDNYNVSWSEGETSVIIKATHKITNTKKQLPVKVVGLLNKYGQITSVSITGPADDLIRLYVYYWDLTPLSLNELKSKKQVVKEFVSDKVAIKWTATNPIISVTKNPTPPMDLFPFKK